jgi:hypothetical protein
MVDGHARVYFNGEQMASISTELLVDIMTNCKDGYYRTQRRWGYNPTFHITHDIIVGNESFSLTIPKGAVIRC